MPRPLALRHPTRILLLLLCFFQYSEAAPSQRRPFSEYEPVRFVVLSASFSFQSQPVKKEILRHLPSGVKAVVYYTDSTDLQDFKKAIPPSEDIELVPVHSHGESYWARDSWPYPVIAGNEVQLVDAPYYPGFEPDEAAAAFFHAPLQRHKFPFEHGNLVANRLGNCLVVQENFARLIPDSAFSENYGCTKITRLPFVTGIGHADEVVKFLADDLVLTDQLRFVDTLKGLGFRVLLLPQAELPAALARRGVMPQRSYVNSLLINGVLFMPSFGLATDAEAKSVYEGAGLTVIPINSAYLADYGGGALHCLSMTYPAFPSLP